MLTAIQEDPRHWANSTVNSAAPSRLHIMHVVLSLDAGGLERVVLHLTRDARAAGHRVSILCLERSGIMAEMARAMGVGLIVLGKQPGLTPRLVTGIRRVLRELRPDVLHTHQIGALLYAGPAARRERVPVVLHTEHTNSVAMARRFSRRLRIRFLWWLASRYADRFCCVSKNIADSAASLVGHTKLRMIQNGIPISEFDGSDDPRPVREALGIPMDAAVVGTIGRLSEEKSQDQVIQAYAHLPRRNPPIHLLLVGDGPRKPALLKLAQDLGVAATVHFAGYQPDARRYLQAMDIFALTSRMEGMPLAILEAWAARLPVIASAVGGIPDLIQDGQTGLLFNFGDQPALESLLLQLLENPDLRRSIGTAGRNRSESDFSTERMARDYQQQYLQILAGKQFA